MPLNRNNFSNHVSLFNVSKNDLFTGLMRYYMSTAGFCRFIVSESNSSATPGVHVLKIRKSSSRELFEVQKNYSKIFWFPNISQYMHIFFFLSQQP